MTKIEQIKKIWKDVTPGPLDVEYDRELEKGCRCFSCYDVDYSTLVVSANSDENISPQTVVAIENAHHDVQYLLDSYDYLITMLKVVATHEDGCYCEPDPTYGKGPCGVCIAKGVLEGEE